MELLSPLELANLLKVKPGKVYSWISRGAAVMKAEDTKSPQSRKTKGKGHSRKSIGSEGNTFEALIDAFIPGASKKLKGKEGLADPSNRLLVMSGKPKRGDPPGTIRDPMALLCDSGTEKSLSEVSDKLGFPSLYEFMDTQIRRQAIVRDGLLRLERPVLRAEKKNVIGR